LVYYLKSYFFVFLRRIKRKIMERIVIEVDEPTGKKWNLERNLKK